MTNYVVVIDVVFVDYVVFVYDVAAVFYYVLVPDNFLFCAAVKFLGVAVWLHHFVIFTTGFL